MTVYTRIEEYILFVIHIIFDFSRNFLHVVRFKKLSINGRQWPKSF
jgi:hypothetical protein